MKILSIDTSTDVLSLAVMDGDKVLSRFYREIGRNHSRLLIPKIDNILKRSRLRIRDIDGFCVGIGPGSFTGLRIGVVTVKGLAYSLNKPIAAISSLDAIAYNAIGHDSIICPVLDARKNKVYAALYKTLGKNLKRISKYLLLPAKDLLKICCKYDKVSFLGDGVSLIGKGEGAISKWHPRADVLGRLGLEIFKKNKSISAEELEPLYLYSRECDIKGI